MWTPERSEPINNPALSSADSEIVYNRSQLDMLLHVIGDEGRPIAEAELLPFADPTQAQSPERQVRELVAMASTDRSLAQRVLLDSTDGQFTICYYPTEAAATAASGDSCAARVLSPEKSAQQSAQKAAVAALPTTAARRRVSQGVVESLSGSSPQPEVETNFSLVGMRFVEKGDDRRLYYGKDRIELGDTSLRIFEVVSLYPEGIEFGRLHRKINKLTGGVTPESLAAHLGAIGNAFVDAGLPYWQTRVRTGESGGMRKYFQVEGVVPRHPATWPAYLDPIRPPMHQMTEKIILDAWKQYAACQVVDTEFFYNDQAGGNQWIARLACSMCTVKDQCLEQEMRIENGQTVQYRSGLYAGLTAANRCKVEQITREQGPRAARALVEKLQKENQSIARNALWTRLRPNVDKTRKPPFRLADLKLDDAQASPIV